ncbi:type VI secretion system baseplate subunit TssG [Niveibacterium microcysteis]|uniref:Type VI secretion system baseplate subunit TssG n=1 Tax=Niveibacterium microcysteis TaxID=2811415 RepID=A0ABX7MC66_9RHOO|nr:type VI secretion system baseplate subunit TssG [Niveibacterium microcysteis]QSI78989.1 type VI secretion system baseplate subunit TssG [Niveibacterium microcysteis]
MRLATDAVRQASRDALLGAIAQAPWKHDFFQALRRLECLYPERPRWGAALKPAEEPIRLGQEPAMSFAPASLSALVRPSNAPTPRLEVRFFGLFGPNGPLPLHLTEYARGRLMNAGDPTFARFADIFHHRLLTLFYRAWAQAQPTVSLDRPDEDRFGYQVGALFGVGLPSLRNRDAMPDFAKLHHAGLLSRQVRNAEGLAKLVSGTFRIHAEVEQFVGHWMTMETRDRTRLGGNTARLGRNALAGQRIWDRQHKFRLHLGPLSFAEYAALLPDTVGISKLAACVRNYTGHEYDWDARLTLKRGEIPKLALGRLGRLGLSGWLGCQHRTKDATDLVLDVERLVRRKRSAPDASKV